MKLLSILSASVLSVALIGCATTPGHVATTAPCIKVEPAHRTVMVGESISVVAHTIDVTGAGPLQWKVSPNVGKITAGRTDIFISGVGLAVKAGAPEPDISTVDALRKTLLAAKSVARSNARSGTYFMSVLERLGIADQMKSKIIMVQGGPVGAAAAKGDAEIAVQQLTELMPVPGSDLVGPLPPELQDRILYSAGIPASR